MSRFQAVVLALSLTTMGASAHAGGLFRGQRASRPAPARTAARTTPARPAAQPAAAQRLAAATGHFPSSPSPIQKFSGAAKLTPQEHASGIHMNRIDASMGGNMHFNGWWDVVQHDTSVVIAQGSAYQGQSVTIGGQRYENAAPVYINPKAGFSERASLHLKGKAGEEVRVLYVRTGPNATIQGSGNNVSIGNVGQSAMVGGDAFRRDVKVTIQAGNGVEPVRGGPFVHYLNDHYGWGRQGQTSTHLGAFANESSARQKYVEPMTPNGR